VRIAAVVVSNSTCFRILTSLSEDRTPKCPFNAGRAIMILAEADSASLAEHSPPIFLTHFVGDACAGQPYQLSKGRIRPARAARQRGNEAGHGRIRVTIKPTQINRADHPASRASHPQEPIACSDGRADCGREQHRQCLRLALVPSGDQALGIFKHLSIGRAAGCRFLLRSDAALILNLRRLKPMLGMVDRG